MIVQTEERDYVRDTTTGALINTNARALQLHKMKREESLRIKRLEDNVDMIMKTMEQILTMLKNNEGK